MYEVASTISLVVAIEVTSPYIEILGENGNRLDLESCNLPPVYEHRLSISRKQASLIIDSRLRTARFLRQASRLLVKSTFEKFL